MLLALLVRVYLLVSVTAAVAARGSLKVRTTVWGWLLLMARIPAAGRVGAVLSVVAVAPASVTVVAARALPARSVRPLARVTLRWPVMSALVI